MSSKIKEVNATASRKYYLTHKEYYHQYYFTHKKRFQQYGKNYYLTHREQILRRTNEYRQQNIEKIRAYDRERNPGRSHAKYQEMKKIIYQYLGTNHCMICDESRVLEVAHIIPVNGGKRYWWKSPKVMDSIWNLLILCPTHHVLFDKDKLIETEFDKIKEKVEYARRVVV